MEAIYTAMFPGSTRSGVYQVAAFRRAWMEVGAAHQKGHPACETCPYSVLEATEGDLSRVDSDCILGSNGEFPHSCPAIGSNA